MTIHSNQNLLQKALIQAAKGGNIELMKEFVEAGANPFEPDEKGHNAIFYANLEDPIKTGSFLLEFAQLIDKYKKTGGGDEQ
jgi:ankyrin repeat protein